MNLSLQGLFEQSWPSVIDRYGQLYSPTAKQAVEEFLPHCSEYLVAYARRRTRTLVHTDFRLDNMFFVDGDLCIIDWQLLGKGDGNGDLSPFLSGNLDADLRRDHEDELLRAYRRRMLDAGSGYEDFDDLLDSYRSGLVFWLAVMGNSAATAELGNERGQLLFERMLDRMVTTVDDHHAWEHWQRG